MDAPDPPAGFESPDWSAPLDTAAAVERTPADVVVKGMYFDGLVREANAKGIDLGSFTAEPGRYRAFKDYPLRELMQLELALAPRLFPDDGPRQGLRRLGWMAYPILLDSLIGKIIFGVLGRDIPGVFRLSAKGYAVSINRGRAQVVESGPHHSHVRLTDMFNFADCYQLGVFEGALRYYEANGEVLVRRVSDIEVELFARWGETA